MRQNPFLDRRGFFKAFAKGGLAFAADQAAGVAVEAAVEEVISTDPPPMVVSGPLSPVLAKQIPIISTAMEIHNEGGDIEGKLREAGIIDHATMIVDGADNRLRIKWKGKAIKSWKTKPGALMTDKPDCEFGKLVDRETRRAIMSGQPMLQAFHGFPDLGGGPKLMTFTRLVLPVDRGCLTVRHLGQTPSLH